MRITAYQGRCTLRKPDENIERTFDAMKKAQDYRADVLCMPETFLHGYFSSREEALENSVPLDHPLVTGIVDRTKGCDPMLLLGLNERRGNDLYNTVIVAHQGKLLGCYSKVYLVYDYFVSGRDFPVFESPGGVKFGIIICADSGYMEPARILALKGARVIFSPHYNAIEHKGVDDHFRRVRVHHGARASENEVYCVRSNVIWPESPIPGQTKLGIGDCFVMNKKGRIVAEAGIFTETLLPYDIPDEELTGPRPKLARVPMELYGLLLETAKDSGEMSGARSMGSPPSSHA